MRDLSRTSRPLSGRAARHKSGFLINHKRELTTLPVLRYSSGHRKGRLKILSISERTLEKLRSLNYLNDETFARNWARSRAETRGYGPKRIEQELSTKGIGQGLIREIVSETFSQVDEVERAKLVLQKRFKGGNLSEPKTLRIATAFLQRRGYSDSVIVEILRVPLAD